MEAARKDPRLLLAKEANTRNTAWRQRANCRDANPELFFDTQGTGTEALAVCWTCPVGPECLAAALNTGDVEDGIYGATTPIERRAMLVIWRNGPPKAVTVRNCTECGKGFEPTSRQKYCTKECQRKAHSEIAAQSHRRRLPRPKRRRTHCAHGEPFVDGSYTVITQTNGVQVRLCRCGPEIRAAHESRQKGVA